MQTTAGPCCYDFSKWEHLQRVDTLDHKLSGRVPWDLTCWNADTAWLWLGFQGMSLIVMHNFSRLPNSSHSLLPPSHMKEREAGEREAEMYEMRGGESRSEKPSYVKCCICIKTIKQLLQQQQQQQQRLSYEGVLPWERRFWLLSLVWCHLSHL